MTVEHVPREVLHGFIPPAVRELHQRPRPVRLLVLPAPLLANYALRATEVPRTSFLC